jgi:hypothetical protein
MGDGDKFFFDKSSMLLKCFQLTNLGLLHVVENDVSL